MHKSRGLEPHSVVQGHVQFPVQDTCMIRLMYTMAYGLISDYIYEIFKLREHLQPTTNCLGLYTYGLFGRKFPGQFWSYCMHRAHTAYTRIQDPSYRNLKRYATNGGELHSSPCVINLLPHAQLLTACPSHLVAIRRGRIAK